MSGMSSSKPARLARTIAHLRPEQVAHRARLRSQKLAMSRIPDVFERRYASEIGEVAWPSDFTPLDLVDLPYAADLSSLKKREFTFIGEHHAIERSEDWRPAERSQLFRYNLHYYEWAWTLAAAGDKELFADLWRSWRDGTQFGEWDEWSPYVVSLRSWALCGTFERLVRDTPIEDDVIEQLAIHAGFIRANLELDVAGNHLIKNLKALLGLGVFLSNEEHIAHAAAGLAAEITRQVLFDGGHYERSPSYHCQVLGDLIDVFRLCGAAHIPQIKGLEDAIARMRTWLGAMLLPDGNVPLFGDSTLVSESRLRALQPADHPGDKVIEMRESGYVVINPGERLRVICDVGAPCPPDLPAHAQAGCLAFVASVDGARAIVDTGTSTYVGDRRAYERSTAAHNTVEVAETNQTEVWGSFRAGRLASPSVHTVKGGDVCVVEASHDGYRSLDGAPIHTRRFEISADRIVIRDKVGGSGFHRLFSRLFLAPGIDAALTEDGEGADVIAPPFAHIGTTCGGEPVPAWIVYASVAQSFGEREACRSVWWEIWEDLPQEFVTEIILGDPVTSDESGIS